MRTMPDHTFARLIRSAETCRKIPEKRITMEIVCQDETVEVRGSVLLDTGKLWWFSKWVAWEAVKESHKDPLSAVVEEVHAYLLRAAGLRIVDEEVA